jgi:iron-sulfur cluster insertion protein
MSQNANISISEPALKQLEILKSSPENKNMLLRITILGGGCSGFQYKFDFGKYEKKDDLKIMHNNKLVAVTDLASYEFIKGAEIDYIDELQGSFFKINNPNASSNCGCGSSFSI